MSGKIDISDFKKGDDILYKSMKIKTHGKKALAPVKAIDLSKIKSKFEINREEFGVNEIHREVYEVDQIYKSGDRQGQVRISSIKSMNEDIELQEAFESTLNFRKNKSRSKDITMCFLDYRGNHYPGKDEIEFIADMSYHYSDLIPFPIIYMTKNIKNPSDFNQYLNFLKQYYEILNTLNEKPIIGIIPKIGRTYLDPLFDFYHGNDINAFYFDFECRQPIKLHPNIRKFFRKLNDEDMLEKCFLHSTNIYSGRFRLSDYAINAKDILSFGLGFDSMGRNMRKPLPPMVIEKLPPNPERRFRLFNKKDYGYYQLQPDKINILFPEDTKLEKKYFTNPNVNIYDIQHNFNMEQQGLEAINLRKIITETTEDYLKEKEFVSEDDVSTLKKVHDFVMKSTSSDLKKEKKSRSLFDF